MVLDELYKKVSDKLYNTFFVDHKKYGRQKEDGSYKLVKETLTHVTIDDMLQNQKSLLTYQELHVVNTARIKWICIDLDISKKEIDNNSINLENLKLVKAAADQVCSFLDSLFIPYLLEFSGRRGFHIWVIFDKFITKELGYRLINVIVKNTETKFDDIIIADKFPKTPYVGKNSKGIGFGIKLPLSQNKVSGKLSFLLDNSGFFDYNVDNWKSKPTIEFLSEQLSILNSVQFFHSEKIDDILDRFEDKTLNTIYKKSRKITTYLKDDINLNQVLESLKKCENLEKILANYETGLDKRERSILVGLLIQLKTKKDDNFGYNLLLELFSNIQGFNEQITKRNLENLRFYQPITCASLDKCSKCNNCSLHSPVELIEGVELIQQPIYSIKQLNKKVFDQITVSLNHYSFQNDEVPLYNFLKRLEKLDFSHTNTHVQKILENSEYPKVESYLLERNEIDKIRELHILDPQNNTIATFFTFILHTLYFSEISNNTYGYQFSPSFYQNNIFNNWFANWATYTKKIETVLFNEEYEEYYVIKFDIKNFYNSIDLKRLKVKILEEAPQRINDKLSELSEADLNRYISIVNYLIWLTAEITGNKEKGLPQGPAYARYLAELYLNGLDRVIEAFILEDDGRGFYNRFVDDAFIFVESEERANSIFKKIKDWLAINGLELNLNKTKFSNVKIYAESGEYQKFKNSSKYDINKTKKNKSVLSEHEIQEGIAKLSDLTNESKFGIKDNLRFFYYQIKDDKRLDFIRKRLSRKLPFSTDGRGTLYWLFYNDLIINHPLIFWELIPRTNEITGLSLTHFLNTILLSENYEEINIIKLIKILHSRSNLSNVDKVLIASLNLKSGSIINLNYDEQIMNAALETPNMRYELAQWKIIEQRLEKTDKLQFLNEIDRIIKNNTYNIDFLQNLSKYCFIRFTEWYTNNSFSSFVNSESTMLLYYHILCFLTLFEVSENYNVVQFSWELLLKQSENFGDLTNKNYEFTWINKLEEFAFDDFSNGSYSLILNDKKGNTLSTSKCSNEFRDQYKSVLLMLLFAKDKASDFKDFRNSINQYIETDSLFYKWVNDINVSLYPQDDEICLKNIALNGLIVLKKSDKLFVKSINKKLKLDFYDYLEISETVNINQEAEYECGNEILENKIVGKNIYFTLQNMYMIIQEHQKFIEKYNTNFLCFYRPAFIKDLKPMIPYYSDKSFESIITTDGTIEKNSLNNYWNNIVDLTSELKNLNLVEDDIQNPYNFTAKELDTRFFPNSPIVIGSIEDKIKFLNTFIELSRNQIPTTIFDFQYYWTSTIFKMVQELDSKNNNLIILLKAHFDHFIDTDGRAKLDILFCINDSTNINDTNLFHFFNTIKSAISIFQNQLSINKDIDLSNEIDVFLIDTFQEDEKISPWQTISDFVLSDLKVTNFFNHLEGKDNYTITIDQQDLSALTFFVFDVYINNFVSADLEELKLLTNKPKVYCKILSKEVYIYIPDDELLKAYSRIVLRNEIYLNSKNTTIPGNENLRKLYPKSLFSGIAEKVYDNYTRKINLKKKLSFHYANNTNIRERIIGWLSLFTEDTIKDSDLHRYMEDKKIEIPTLYQVILEVLEAHYYMDTDDLDFFKNTLLKYKEDKNSIIFPIKNPKFDENGLSRLIDKCQIPTRTINYLEYKTQLFTADCKDKDLIILTDLSISGSQFINSWKYYTTKHDKNTDMNMFNNSLSEGKNATPHQERYFCFNSIEESITFNENLNKINNITILSPIITKKFAGKINALDNSIKLQHSKKLIEEEKYLYGKARLHNASDELFKVLCLDIGLISKLFNDVSFYKRNISEEKIKKSNIILRTESLPAKHLLLLSLEAKNGIRLLDHILNWKK